MDFEEYSQKTVKEINKELEKLLKSWRDEVRGLSKDLLPLVDKFIATTRNGKGIRGTLVYLGYQLVSRNLKNKDIFKVAAAYELFHTAILAHDDIIDQSPTRRGQPSLYQALGGNHYGISQAICLADTGFFLAVKIIAETSFPDKQKNEALKLFSQTMLSTAIGEMLDVEKGNVSTIMKLKTARYTVSGPLMLGMVLGGEGSTSQRLRGVKEFGENLGIAFQIQDDILGVFGSPKQIGKSAASDIEEGKVTVLYNFALKKANLKQKQLLDKYYGQGNPGEEKLEQLRQVFRGTGALEFAEDEAKRYQSRALKILPEMTRDKNMSKLLEQVAESLVKRVK